MPISCRSRPTPPQKGRPSGPIYGNDSDIGIAYRYCNFKRHNEQRLQDLLTNLLKQLAQGLPSLPDAVKMLYHQHRGGGTRPSIEEISKALHSVSSHFSRLFIVIDALDECQTSNGLRTRILYEIFDLQVECSLNFLATSRFIPERTESFDDKPSLEIRAKTHDMMRYPRGHLDKLPSFVRRSLELQNEILIHLWGRSRLKQYGLRWRIFLLDQRHMTLHIMMPWSGLNKAVVQLLLDKGADLDSRDRHGRTSLLWAAARGRDLVVALLSSRTVDPNPKDQFCRTPLHAAAAGGTSTWYQHWLRR